MIAIGEYTYPDDVMHEYLTGFWYTIGQTDGEPIERKSNELHLYQIDFDRAGCNGPFKSYDEALQDAKDFLNRTEGNND